ncbi:MAG: hypothetical protein INH41_14830 [Myxococcaceae bacterium]|jgi:hypothetical protein|nr:hypothetical protein [Myxococcaceae bacterium]MCA3013654.1 hypothetical protein [Myxococcaceae bacterium]
MFSRVSFLCVMMFAVLARAEEPPVGAEARLLMCGSSSAVQLSVFTWEVVDGRVRVHQRTGALDTGAQPPKSSGKPPVGCPFGLPAPSAAWHLREVTSFERTASGWVDAKGKPVSVTCTARTISAVRNATALVPNPRSDGCGGSRQLILSGGPRVEVPVVRCVVSRQDEAPLTLTFGAERVASENDCGGGGDWRING